jgi:hypothetical protein
MSMTFSIPGMDKPFLNLANGNFATLMEGLYPDGYDPHGGDLSASDLLLRISRMKRTLHQGRGGEFTRQPLSSTGANGAKLIEFGIDESYLLERLDVLAQLANLALANQLPLQYS